jgi:muconolactone delta-isomerase
LLFHLTGTITDVDKLPPYKDEEIRIFGKLRSEGVVKHGFRRANEPGIFLIVEADSVEAAREQMARLPFVAEDLLVFEYVEVSEM